MDCRPARTQQDYPVSKEKKWQHGQWAVAPATKSHHLGLIPETLVVEGQSSLTHIMACEQPNSRH